MKLHWIPFLILFLFSFSCSQNDTETKPFTSRQSPTPDWKQNRKIVFSDNQRRRGRIGSTRALTFRGLRRRAYLPCPALVKSTNGKKNKRVIRDGYSSRGTVFEDTSKHINSQTYRIFNNPKLFIYKIDSESL